MNNNCYVNVIGGVGNQLFQIAAGYVYAKKYDKKLIINPHSWIAGQGTNPIEYKSTIFKNFQYGSLQGDITPIHEKRFNYDELPFVEGSVLLNGYFQSLKYFEEFKDEFISLLNLPEIDNNIISEVGVHIRRGDYKYSSDTFPCVPNSYYIEALLKYFNNPTIVVSTDDWQAVHTENLLEGYNIVPIRGSNEIEDLYLLSQCSNLIIGNSTFAWWAAILGSVKKRVIVASPWFGPAGHQDYQDIYCKDWNILCY